MSAERGGHLIQSESPGETGRDQATFAGPGEPARSSDTGFGLPADLLAKSRQGVRVAAWLVVAGSGIDLFFMILGVAFGTDADLTTFPGSMPIFGNVFTAALSIAMIAVSRSDRVRGSTVVRLALVYEALLCASISVSNPLTLYRGTGVLPVMTWVTPLIILFPLLVPCPPRLTLYSALASVATVPLGLSLLSATGLAAVNGGDYASALFSPLLAVLIAVYGSKLLYGLGLEVAKARRMGSYQLERLLGRGGMGEVWLARHRLLARPAAIKLVRPELVGASARRTPRSALQRFEREAQATAAMRSPHTVGLYDYGVAPDGTFYYVMELLDGFNADALVRQFGPLPAGRAIHLLRQVCHSLAEAHEAGLIHRDIKPANIFVCRYGRDVDFVKVLDFGLVKAFRDEDDESVNLTAQSVAIGTPSYMAPEQASGQAQDARSDLYAVGCVAYWLVTGHAVFQADSALALAMHHLTTPPIAPSARAETAVPDSLDRLILSCLAKSQADRPESAVALDAALAACAVDSPWDEEHARQWWQRHAPQAGSTLSR